MTPERPALLLLCLLHISWSVNGEIPNIPYGPDSQQVFDIYLPIGTPENETKVILLIHGGSWKEGQKSDMAAFAFYLQEDLPGYYIANMEYRLGTLENPGFPKQLEDIALVIAYIKSSFAQQVTFALMGSSAGGHLAMLYEYSRDPLFGDDVKAVISHVGPTDLTDPIYSTNPIYDELFFYLVGPCYYSECPDVYNAASPVAYLNEGAAPTIGFYGNSDILVPTTQMTTLKGRLDQLGVHNKFTVYEGGHGDWSLEDQMDMMNQISEFLRYNW